MVGQLIQNLVWIFPNGSTANTKPCLDTSKWWVNGPSKTIWMDLNESTACYQHCSKSNGITMCVQNQWAFLKVEILNGFKWSISRRVNVHLLGEETVSEQMTMLSSICSIDLHWRNRVYMYMYMYGSVVLRSLYSELLMPLLQENCQDGLPRCFLFTVCVCVCTEDVDSTVYCLISYTRKKHFDELASRKQLRLLQPVRCIRFCISWRNPWQL